MSKAVEKVNRLILRLINGEPWSTWLVRNADDKIVAWWTIGYDDHKGHLQAALMVKKEYQNQGMAKAIWEFTSKYLFPILHRQGATVQSQTDLKKVNLYALMHPDHKVMNYLLEKAGFKRHSQTYHKDFENKSHDGRRNRWEIPIAKLLEQK